MNSKTYLAIGAALLLGAATRADLPASITTTDGQTYNSVSLIRAEPDGYLVNYEPVKAGMGVAKIKYSRLSADQQKEAGYDPAKAHDFEAKITQDAQAWRQENLRAEQAAKTERQAAEAREDQADQRDIARLTALAELKQAEANLAHSQNENVQPDYGWSLGGGIGAFAIPEVSNPHAVHPQSKALIFQHTAPLQLHTPPFVGAPMRAAAVK